MRPKHSGFSSSFAILVIIITTLAVRAINLPFPFLTSDEARIAYRGYTLATYGKDELGRPFPLLFNSLRDYQLPAVSYLTASGEFIFGKSELGARIPFIIIGVALVFLIYQIAKIFSADPAFWLISALVAAFSPALIFLSKIPNEAIVLTFIFTLLFYLLISNQKPIFIMLTMVASVFTSKQAWFILLPLTFFTVFFCQGLMDKKKKFILVCFSAVMVFLALTLFLSIPQSKRSLLENNFSIFSNVTIRNGIDRLRGQGIKAGWPEDIDRLLFNKAQFAEAGFLHWLSNISPALYFGKFDGTGERNYSYLGAWPKVLILPFISGLFFLIKGSDSKKKYLLFYFLLLTFPSVFVYPDLSLELVTLTLPFIAPVIALGLGRLKKKIAMIILVLMLMEVGINIFNLNPEYRNTTVLRPAWVKGLVNDVFEKSNTFKTAVSDDIVPDIASYIEWHTSFNPQAGFQQIPSPYKFRQYQLSDIKIVGSDEKYNTCGKSEKMEVFVSNRDLKKIRQQFEVTIINTYRNGNGEEMAYLIDDACIK